MVKDILIDKLDETIIQLCEEVRNERMMIGGCKDDKTIMALAMLVEARAIIG